MLVVDLGKWMNKTLINWGIDPAVADRFDETIMALLMIVVAIVLNYLCQAILIGGMKQYTRRKPHQWNTLLMKRRVFHNLIHTIPAFLVYSLLPMAFIRGKELLLISQKACVIYIIFSLLLAINGILLMIMDIYDGRESMKDRPMKGFIQVLQVLLFFVGGIVIIAIIVNKSPATLVMDKMILLGESKIQVLVISPKWNEVQSMLYDQIDRGCTLMNITTGYKKQDMYAVMSVVSRRELVTLTNEILKIDEAAFIITNETHNVRGRGFTLPNIDL